MQANLNDKKALRPDSAPKKWPSISINFRKDGVPLKNITSMQKILPYIFKTRTESLVYSPERLDFTTAREYIKRKNKENPGLNLGTFHIVIAALVRTISSYPYLNRFISGKKLYARNYISFSFIVLKNLGGKVDETSAKLYFEKTDTLFDVALKVKENIEYCRSTAEKDDDRLMYFVSKLPSPLITILVFMVNKFNDWGLLPKSFIDTDPLFTSAFISNLGSIGHGAINHHLYEWGNSSIFITMGALDKINEKDSQGNSVTKCMLDVVFTLDERIAYGYYLVKALKYFKSLIKHPERLELPPDIIVEDDGI
ncbi:hypothetical protein [Clostridium polynesiense]|uniref:hypothetical protein n=1 Tax=Clostridium polynesiense TaxID=1325933 RepID=UPI00058E5A8D|nr:hypothetical protein [Clostridium polynesiense]